MLHRYSPIAPCAEVKCLSATPAAAGKLRGARSRPVPAAFTLFEVILSIALSTVLLAVIGMAINLYLTRIERGRSEVEWAQLARSIFSMIAEDLRGASEYKTQDTSGAAAAAASLTTFDPNSVDAAGGTGTGGTGTGGTGGSGDGSTSAFGGTSFAGTTSGTTAGAESGMGATSTTGGLTAEGMTTTPGVYGSLVELVIDVSRPLRLDELFGTYTGYTNVKAVVERPGTTGSATSAMSTPMAGAATLHKTGTGSDLKTVRWLVRQGQAVDPNSEDITSMAADAQYRGAGLVRQEVDRAQRLWAEQSNDLSILESGQRLIAPEVVGMQFRYFDGSEVLEYWDTQTMGRLPLAVEVRLWLAEPEVANSVQVATMGSQGVLANAREFRQTIFLPTAQPPSAASGTTTTTTY